MPNQEGKSTVKTAQAEWSVSIDVHPARLEEERRPYFFVNLLRTSPDPSETSPNRPINGSGDPVCGRTGGSGSAEATTTGSAGSIDPAISTTAVVVSVPPHELVAVIR